MSELAAGIADKLARGTKQQAAVARRRLKRALETGTILRHVAEAHGLVGGTAATDDLRGRIRANIGEAAEAALYEQACEWGGSERRAVALPAYVEGVGVLLRALRGSLADERRAQIVAEAAAAMCTDAVAQMSKGILEEAGIASDPRLNVRCETSGCTNEKVQLIFVQTRSIDEPKTAFYACSVCGMQRRVPNY